MLAGCRCWSVAAMVLVMWCGPAWAQSSALPVHGGPIRAVAADGSRIVSGSFDGTAILWPEATVLRGHDGAVNAVALLSDGGIATGGADGRILIWHDGARTSELVGHTGPVVALAAQGQRLASASWDGTARVWSDGTSRVLSGHAGNVNAVAFAPDGRVATAGYDGTLRIWSADAVAQVIGIGSPQNAVVVAPDGEIATGGADGILRLIAADGTRREIQIDTMPLTGLAISSDGGELAVTSIGGVAMIVDRRKVQIRTVLLGSERPLWAVAFAGSEVITGGAGRVLRRWDANTGRSLGTLGLEPVEEAAGEGRGAQIFRACSACHSLGPDGGNRAGPSLHGLFGRRIGSLPGYAYSAALRGMALVWTPETVARLFTIGPATFTPGTKMPEQVIADESNRAALIRFLEDATK